MPLDASDVRTFRKNSALTQAALASLVGVQSNTVARWERGEVRVPEPTARLIRLLAVLAEDEPGKHTTDVIEPVELIATVWTPLAGYMSGQRTPRDARAALTQLRRRGRRGRV